MTQNSKPKILFFICTVVQEDLFFGLLKKSNKDTAKGEETENRKYGRLKKRNVEQR